MFIDYSKIYVKAGQGGSGCVSFRREKFVPKGGPDGGDGGQGGSIILVADANLSTLIDFRYRREYKAKHGQHGMGSNKHGKGANDIIIKVPVGTVVKDVETGEQIADLLEDQQEFVAAQGGRGGKGNARYATATNRSPREWQVGWPGEERWLELELKLIADIGLVGMPNAGKSTLLSRISAARPKIGDYPFTTLEPNLGIVKYHEYSSFVVADIPGLIEGAHEGKGLGHQFLRHIERTRALAYVLDGSEEDPLAVYKVLKNELKSFSKLLIKKPFIILLNKSDVADLSDKAKAFPKRAKVLTMSAATGDNIASVINAFAETLKKAKEEEEAL
jgi:GTP-binding protein